MALILDLEVEIDVSPNRKEVKLDATGHLPGWVDCDCHLMVKLRL